jgi:large exoprotein involved in heme utilization and adhesion
VLINARDTVAFDGVGSNGESSGAFSNVEETGIGDGGNINITSGSLRVSNGAFLVTSTFGQGRAGSVSINARDTVAFDGVGSNGESSGAYRNVGETSIDYGGGISITAESLEVTNGAQLVGITEGQGKAGSGYSISLTIPIIDPSRGLANLPAEVVDASNQIAQTCGAGGREVGKNEFIVTGRRGMPSNPYEPLSNDQALEDIHPPSGFSSRRNSNPDAAKAVTSQSVTSNPKPSIVEAQGWVMNDKGQVVLTATASTATPHNSLPASATCPSS